MPALVALQTRGPQRCSTVARELMPANDPGFTRAVERVLNENSYLNLGHRSYQDGDAPSSPTGPTITMDSIFQEDLLIASVLVNRLTDPLYRVSPNTLYGQATQAGGPGTSLLPNGPTLFVAGMNAPMYTPLCLNLLAAIEAVGQVVNEGSTAPHLRNWRGRLRPGRQGGLFVANAPSGSITVNNSFFY